MSYLCNTPLIDAEVLIIIRKATFHWSGEKKEIKNLSLQSNCSLYSSPGLQGRTDDYIWMNTWVTKEIQHKQKQHFAVYLSFQAQIWDES